MSRAGLAMGLVLAMAVMMASSTGVAAAATASPGDAMVDMAVAPLKAKLAALAKQLAMHVAAANPQSLTVADLDQAAIERERSVLAEKAGQSGKAADLAEQGEPGADQVALVLVLFAVVCIVGISLLKPSERKH